MLAKKLEAQSRAEVEKHKKELAEQFNERQRALEMEMKQFEEKKKKENEIFKQRLNKAVQEKERDVKSKVRGNLNTCPPSTDTKIER